MPTVEPLLAEYECVLSALFGDWAEVGHLAMAATGTQFRDERLGELYDLTVDVRLGDPTAGAFQLKFDSRLSLAAEGALTELLLWAGRAGHAPHADTFAAALDVITARPVPRSRQPLAA